MAIRPIVEVPDPRLREISKPVEGVDDELRTLVADMFETMYEAPGIGLAAIQVGVPKRVLVIDLQEPEEEGGEPVKDPRVFINPEILQTSDQDVPYTEGCLSVPEQFAEVDRPTKSAPAGWNWTARSARKRSTACWPFAFSTRWII
jgi:peptide deformylase